MEIRELQYFLAVVEHENISKAAEELFITQPNLSRQMQNLEAELGKKLFVRGKRKIVLTEAGIQLRKRAEEIVSLVGKAKEELSATAEHIVGTVEIGGGESCAVKLIARAAKAVQDQHPQIQFRFFSGDTADVVERLDQGLLDFGILIEPADLTRYECIRLPIADTWGILVRKDSALAEKAYVTPMDLRSSRLIFSKHALGRNAITEWFQIGVKALNIVATYNLIYNASLMVEEGMGYAVGLDRLINTSGDSNLRFIPFAPKLTSNLYVAWKKQFVLSRADEVFLNELRQTLAQFKG
ncbi:MAG: LysR family transcriptional regulator [Clostridia bacterium]|nr:LysR family transcriptional regulator [Clostridia bacterium]